MSLGLVSVPPSLKHLVVVGFAGKNLDHAVLVVVLNCS